LDLSNHGGDLAGGVADALSVAFADDVLDVRVDDGVHAVTGQRHIGPSRVMGVSLITGIFTAHVAVAPTYDCWYPLNIDFSRLWNEHKYTTFLFGDKCSVYLARAKAN
jgi:hypothetical protein